MESMHKELPISQRDEAEWDALFTFSSSLPPSSPISDKHDDDNNTDGEGEAAEEAADSKDKHTSEDSDKGVYEGVPRMTTDQHAESDFADEPYSSMNPSTPPVSNDHETARQIKRRKGHQKRVRTLARQQEEREAHRREEALAVADAAQRAVREAASAKTRCFENTLATLKDGGQTWGDFVEWISRPSSGHQTERYEGLFRDRQQISRILDLWAWKNTRTGSKQVQIWATNYLSKIVSREAADVTRQGILQSRRICMTDAFIQTFNLSSVHDRIREICPGMTSLLRAFSTTRRQQKQASLPTTTARERDMQLRRGQQNNTVSAPHVDMFD